MRAAGDTILPLALQDVWYNVDGVNLLKAINLAFTAGVRTAVIGPNGAGKSLLMRIMHGLIKPSQGTVEWQGQAADGRHKSLAARQAMVFQRPVMLRRSVAANIEYALKLIGVASAERRERTEEILDKTGLRRLASSPARVLSGGEQQRLALARVWARNPEVLFLDEPTANLDPAATHRVEEIVSAIHAGGTRLIMTTHDLGQARRMADDVIFMHRGRVFEHRDTEAFFAGPENDLAQAFVRGELLWWRKGEGTGGRRQPRHEKYRS
ncbi:MAG: ATP-binding cassette domain-containing protein [Rhodospirillales bacterium]